MKRLLLVLLSVLLATTPVSAIPSDTTLDTYDINGIYYYDDSGCTDTTPVEPSGENITWIGDSYTAMAEEDYHLISTNLPGTDLGTSDNPYYQVSKHIQMTGGPGNLGGPSGLDILKSIKEQNKLRAYLVFALSTNDTDFGNNPSALESQLNILIDSKHAGTDTQVILVSPRINDSSINPTYDSISNTMRNFANAHSNVSLADWNQAASGKEAEFFAGSDSTHPNEQGMKVWFDTIKNTLPIETNGNTHLDSAALPAETIHYLDEANVKNLAESNMARYKYAEQQTKLPWQILATLHYREGGMGSNQSISNGEELYDHINVDGIHISADPNQDAVDAANHFIDIAKEVYGVDVINDPTMENYAMGFLAYNRGYMYKSAGATWKESPYVMSGYDAEHMNMRWIHADSWYNGQRINSVEGKINRVPGALAILAYLGITATYSGEGCEIAPSNGGAAIAQMAVSMSWPFQDGSKSGHCLTIGGNLVPYSHRDGSFGCSMNPRDTYEDAVAKYNIPHASTYGYESCKGQTYCDCGMFVQTVLAATFPDEAKEIAAHSPNIHEEFVEYLLSQPDKWEEIENKGNTSNLEPGDIFLNPGHRMIYVGEYGGKWGDLASASAGQNVGEISDMYFNSPSGPFRIFRRKGGISENGLTEEQAAKLLAWYAQNKNNDSANYAPDWWINDNHSDFQCTAFSAFFVNKFTNQKLNGRFDGGTAVPTAISQSGGTVQSEPEVFSLFSVPGHTGIVVGKKDDGTIITANYNGTYGRETLPESPSVIQNFNPEEFYYWTSGGWNSHSHAYGVDHGYGISGVTPQFLKLDVDEQKLLNYINKGP